MNKKKNFFSFSISVALAAWILISLSILQEVIESRKNTIAARPTGYIQERVKAKISTSRILTSEPLIVVKIFGLIFVDVAVVWGLLWVCYRMCTYYVSRLKYK